MEESDLQSWRASGGGPQSLCKGFDAGVKATLSVYASRAKNSRLGAELSSMLRQAGFTPTSSQRRTRTVRGGSAEAQFHKVSARQLADSIRAERPEVARLLDEFSAYFDDPQLEYETRATVSIAAGKTLVPSDGAPPPVSAAEPACESEVRRPDRGHR